MKIEECKVGDKIEAVDNTYYLTALKNKWVGKILEINGTHIDCVTLESLNSDNIHKTFTGLNPEHFKKVEERKEEKVMTQKNSNPRNKVIVYNNRAVAYFDENGKKFTSVCDEKDEFDLEKGIAMAILKSKGINYTTVKELARTRKVYKSKEKNPKVA